MFIKNKKAMTLVEIVVALSLTVIIVLVAYMIFSTVQKSYQATSDKIDAQSQFRLINDVLEENVKNAQTVELYTEAYFNDPANSTFINTKKAAGNFLYISTVSGIERGMFNNGTQIKTPYPLKDLTISFSQGTTAGTPDSITTGEAITINVAVNARGVNELNSKILLQNIAFSLGSSPVAYYGTGIYSVIYYVSY